MQKEHCLNEKVIILEVDQVDPKRYDKKLIKEEIKVKIQFVF